MYAAQKMADTYHLSATAESISFSSHLTKCTQLLQNAIIKVQIHHQRILFAIDIKSKKIIISVVDQDFRKRFPGERFLTGSQNIILEIYCAVSK